MSRFWSLVPINLYVVLLVGLLALSLLELHAAVFFLAVIISVSFTTIVCSLNSALSLKESTRLLLSGIMVRVFAGLVFCFHALSISSSPILQSLDNKGSLYVSIASGVILLVLTMRVVGKNLARLGELIARFTLEAMPGRQHSIETARKEGMFSAFEAYSKKEGMINKALEVGSLDPQLRIVGYEPIIILLLIVSGGLGFHVVASDSGVSWVSVWSLLFFCGSILLLSMLCSSLAFFFSIQKVLSTEGVRLQRITRAAMLFTNAKISLVIFATLFLVFLASFSYFVLVLSFSSLIASVVSGVLYLRGATENEQKSYVYTRDKRGQFVVSADEFESADMKIICSGISKEFLELQGGEEFLLSIVDGLKKLEIVLFGIQSIAFKSEERDTSEIQMSVIIDKQDFSFAFNEADLVCTDHRFIKTLDTTVAFDGIMHHSTNEVGSRSRSLFALQQRLLSRSASAIVIDRIVSRVISSRIKSVKASDIGRYISEVCIEDSSLDELSKSVDWNTCQHIRWLLSTMYDSGVLAVDLLSIVELALMYPDESDFPEFMAEYLKRHSDALMGADGRMRLVYLSEKSEELLSSVAYSENVDPRVGERLDSLFDAEEKILERGLSPLVVILTEEGWEASIKRSIAQSGRLVCLTPEMLPESSRFFPLARV